MRQIDRGVLCQIKHVIVQISSFNAVAPRSANYGVDFTCKQRGQIVHFYLIRIWQKPVLVFKRSVGGRVCINFELNLYNLVRIDIFQPLDVVIKG